MLVWPGKITELKGGKHNESPLSCVRHLYTHLITEIVLGREQSLIRLRFKLVE